MGYCSITPWRLMRWMLSFWVIVSLGTLLIGCSESGSSNSTDVLAKQMAQAQIKMNKVATHVNLSIMKSVDSGIDEPGYFFYYRDGDETVIVVRFPLSMWSLEWGWYWKEQDLILCRDRLIPDRAGGAYVPPRQASMDRYLYFQNNRLVYSTDAQDRNPATFLKDDEVLSLGEFFRKFTANNGEEVNLTDIPGWMEVPPSENDVESESGTKNSATQEGAK